MTLHNNLATSALLFGDQWNVSNVTTSVFIFTPFLRPNLHLSVQQSCGQVALTEVMSLGFASMANAAESDAW